jgi:hypothetical protein
VQLPGVPLEVDAGCPRDQGEDIRRLHGANGNHRADDVDKEGPDDYSLKYLLYSLAMSAVYQHEASIICICQFCHLGKWTYAPRVMILWDTLGPLPASSVRLP